MVFISAVLVVILNILLGLAMVNFVRVIMFHPSKAWYIGSHRVPLTPALVFRQKEYLINKLNLLIDKLLYECEKYDYNSSISRLERRVYNHIWQRIEEFESQNFIPLFIVRMVKKIAAQVCYELFHYFIRTFIPFLIEKYRAEGYLDMLRNKIDIYVVRDYYVKYVHRYLVYAALIVFSLLGFYNMIVFLVVR